MTARLDPTKAVILFADLQPVLAGGSGTNPPGLIEAGAGALVEAAAKLRTFAFASERA